MKGLTDWGRTLFALSTPRKTITSTYLCCQPFYLSSFFVLPLSLFLSPSSLCYTPGLFHCVFFCCSFFLLRSIFYALYAISGFLQWRFPLISFSFSFSSIPCSLFYTVCSKYVFTYYLLWGMDWCFTSSSCLSILFFVLVSLLLTPFLVSPLYALFPVANVSLLIVFHMLLVAFSSFLVMSQSFSILMFLYYFISCFSPPTLSPWFICCLYFFTALFIFVSLLFPFFFFFFFTLHSLVSYVFIYKLLLFFYPCFPFSCLFQ